MAAGEPDGERGLLTGESVPAAAVSGRHTSGTSRHAKRWDAQMPDVALGLIALLTVLVLVLGAGGQVYDSNHYALTEATAILAGDHPYRDFFEVGIPLDVYMAAFVQRLSGHRLIGEFGRHWIFIVAGVLLACHLGVRLAQSTAAILVVTPLVLLILAVTPIYHSSKLLIFPLTIWLAWRYIESPKAGRGAALGLLSALAFLYRHDYGIYTGFASVTAFLLARAAEPSSRRLPSMVGDGAAYTVTVALVLAPWAAVVQANEGLIEYTKLRAALYQAPPGFVHASLFAVNPLRQFAPAPSPPPRPAIVAFRWDDAVDDDLRARLEREHGLQQLDDRDPRGRWRYRVPDVYDVRLLELEPHITDGTGFEWDRLEEIAKNLPAREGVVLWLQQMALVVPILLVAAAAVQGWRSRRDLEASSDVWRMVSAGVFLVFVDAALIRQPSYVVVVAPVTAALGARFLAQGSRVGRAAAAVVLAATTFAAFVWAKEAPVFRPSSELREAIRNAFVRLTASPPDYGDHTFAYLRACTRPGDRLLVTGQTPAHVSYYAGRPIAGGHINWHHGWGADPVHEARSLALLARQAVPFAVSTHDPVLEDFRRYPRILDHLTRHYVELEGSGGLVLVDARRTPTGRWGPSGWPCFR
jgi:hypothetical protein